MSVIVTGGAGFIGSHLVDALVSQGRQVHILDNLSTGHLRNVNPKAVFHQGDLLAGGLHQVFREVKPEFVFHHAAQVDVQASLAAPQQDAQTNIAGTVAVLEACRLFGVRKIIYASSAAVYGSPLYLPVDEGHAIRPLSFYGISKYTPELYLESYAALYGLDFTILRYANVYGDRQSSQGEGGVVSQFVGKLLLGERPVIYGDGEQTRDFVYVKDIVGANLAAMTRGSRGVYNIGMNQQTSVNELLTEMCAISGVPFEPRYASAREGDVLHSRLSNAAAMNDLEWQPAYTLRSGLEATIAYYRTQREQRILR